MSVKSQIDRIKADKEDIRAAIAEKGQSVPATALLSAYGEKIRAIQTGTDTSDATAAAGDILSGKTAYVGGKKVAGTMPAATQATPSISVSSAGLITASAAQSAGYVAAGTKSATKQLTTQAAQTITPGTSNQTIASGKYLTGAQTIKGDANLKAENIKSGVSIFGVSGSAAAGLDTSDATATASTIRSGYTAYVKGQKITGTVATQAGKTVTPGTAAQTAVASGRITTGAVTVAGDANLTAGNIKKGVSIFGVSGTYAGTSGGSTGTQDSFEVTISISSSSTAIANKVNTYYADSDGIINSLAGKGSFVTHGPFVVYCSNATTISSNLNITVTGGTYKTIQAGCFLVSPTAAACKVAVSFGSSGGTIM